MILNRMEEFVQKSIVVFHTANTIEGESIDEGVDDDDDMKLNERKVVDVG